jgi:hypothetical protein
VGIPHRLSLRDRLRVRPQAPVQRAEQPRQEPEPETWEPARSGLYVPWWTFAAVILAVTAVTCGMWAYLMYGRPDVALGGLTPTFIVITNTPTLGAIEVMPPIEDTPTIVEPSATPAEPSVTPTLPPGEVAVGGQVTVTGTEGAGVVIRQGPGVSYDWFSVGEDGEVFNVEDGPRENDGYTWWYISDPKNPDRAGWAAQNFLQPIPSEPGAAGVPTLKPAQTPTQEETAG